MTRRSQANKGMNWSRLTSKSFSRYQLDRKSTERREQENRRWAMLILTARRHEITHGSVGQL
jgi:hypothetical protein